MTFFWTMQLQSMVLWIKLLWIFGRGGRHLVAIEALSEFLDELVFRSQCWCLASIGGRGGFKVGSNDAILLYVMLKGSAILSSVSNQSVGLDEGDMVAVIDRRSHTIRSDTSCAVEELSFLNSAQYVDSPPVFSFGSAEPDRQILCGRLLVRWTGNIGPTDLPAMIKVRADDSLVRLDTLINNSQGNGSAATLTHAASLVLVSAMLLDTDIQSLFDGRSVRNPIARAKMLMEERPHEGWTVSSLARKVGMGRSVFATRFLAEIGKPPFEVLTGLRMELARELLLETELKISEVGEKVGYRSESAFQRRFTLHFNIPPGKLRRDRALGER